MIVIEGATGVDRSGGPASSGSRPELISVTYRRLRCMDFDDAEAANLTALKNGFGITSQPWAVRELTHLLFLRHLRRGSGRWTDLDDRADTRDRTSVPSVVRRTPAQAISGGAPAPFVQWNRGDDSEPTDGRITLLTLFRSIAGPDATLDHIRFPAPDRPDAGGGTDREGG